MRSKTRCVQADVLPRPHVHCPHISPRAPPTCLSPTCHPLTIPPRALPTCSLTLHKLSWCVLVTISLEGMSAFTWQSLPTDWQFGNHLHITTPIFCSFEARTLNCLHIKWNRNLILLVYTTQKISWHSCFIFQINNTYYIFRHNKI